MQVGNVKAVSIWIIKAIEKRKIIVRKRLLMNCAHAVNLKLLLIKFFRSKNVRVVGNQSNHVQYAI